MSDEDRKAGEDQDQMEDQREFEADPRGGRQVSGQQGETQPADDAGELPAEDREQGRGETGRDDPGEASGNPPNAG